MNSRIFEKIIRKISVLNLKGAVIYLKRVFINLKSSAVYLKWTVVKIEMGNLFKMGSRKFQYVRDMFQMSIRKFEIKFKKPQMPQNLHKLLQTKKRWQFLKIASLTMYCGLMQPQEIYDDHFQIPNSVSPIPAVRSRNKVRITQ